MQYKEGNGKEGSACCHCLRNNCPWLCDDRRDKDV